ncbi:hypothetical protein M427DRAFT_154364 [Gonapodya prolifera JEL478]|uniref:Uncharacterized protein n=1 Tax=Gonapodya prolifera (strain JEL478) TaxID=1344416 RepID=A0A139AJ12_GONPJ|nr:hypothetical protein M427DRAFT_154364 [Gonapodya prolifera JEL478]|eukprot:KXS16385.1 hypothetical protein M427DRAFT_154364 [Gonapodya prolifera JEL478]
MADPAPMRAVDEANHAITAEVVAPTEVFADCDSEPAFVEHLSAASTDQTVLVDETTAALQPAPVVDFATAMSFVMKVKTRFASTPGSYERFLKLLRVYQQGVPLPDVVLQVRDVFKGEPDLAEESKCFYLLVTRISQKHAQTCEKNPSIM